MNLFSKSAAASLLMLAAAQAKLPIAQPEEIGVASQQLEHIGAIINTAITKQSLPGAVVLIGCHGKVIYRKAFGNKSLEPHIVSMQEDTIFDLASLTKVVATTTSIMMLVERGLVRLGEPVATYIPEFGQNGKEKITVEQLLLHTGGFAPDFNFSKDFNLMQASKKITDITPEELRAQFYSRAPDYPPGTQCIYSCLSFLVLGELITRISKQTLDSFCYENIFQPLNMTDTMFLLDNKRMLRAAPQDKKTVSWLSGNVNNPRNNLDKPAWLYGKVHDPKASLLGGVAGNAGLFSTVDDLAIFCQMILNLGSYQGKKILSPASIKKMILPRELPEKQWRCLGWDFNSCMSGNLGDFFKGQAFGHTGFTGTSILIDPISDLFIIFLSNRLHPDGTGNVISLRGRIANIVASAIIT